VVGVVGVFRDITDHVLVEAELIRARDEARASAEAKSAFLATMSHEIRTPMTGVLGMIELLRTDLSPEDRTRFFDNLEQSASLLMTVLDDVLDFSKIEARNLILERVDFDMVELTRNTLDLFHHSASKKGLLLSMAAPVGRDAMVKGDPVRLQQVMSNLISNAVKFTQSGKVELRLAIEGTERKRFVTCEVTDTGIGIAPAAIEELFEPFVQADVSTTRRFGGTGLGLAISKRLVEAMHGSIDVESVEGKGTTFRFAVTLEAGTREAEVRAVKGQGSARQLSVLLAEDNQINRALVEAIVRRSGHSIHSVENGRLAVAAAETGAYDVILMDMQMPEMDGLAATREIRKGQGACRDVPIIALTADASAERRRFYDNVGLTEFLTKPIDTDLLTERLQMIAGGDHATTSANRGAEEGQHELINEVKLKDLERAIGLAGVNHLLDMLGDELKARPLLIRDMIAQKSLVVVAVEAHALKGATLNIGAERVGQLAQSIEEACDTGAVPESLGEALVAAARATRILLDGRKKGVSFG
jgi:CheY-like chemotaxis protein/nitrogen-specific signal transduction histidine kinase/HPt (histidine-containing phosphotransfer) domain-containing protein